MQYKKIDESIFIHEYFDSKSADWNITGFLEECTEKSYQLKIGLYLKSLENIMNNEQGSRKKKAQLLYDKYKKDTRPDHQIAKNWEAERRANKTSSGPSINIHNSTFSGSDQRIGTIGDESFNVGNSKRTRERVLEKDNNEESKRRKMDGENYQPYFHVEIPPQRVVPPPHLPRTPEHQTFSLSSLVSPSTSENEETDNDDSDSDDRDPKNFTLDEFVDGKDEYVDHNCVDDDDDQERVFLNDSDGSDNVYDNPYMFQEINISALFASYRSNACQIARESGLSIETDYCEILSLSHILLLQVDKFSDLQIQEFSRDTLEQLRKNMRNSYAAKTKVAPDVKALFREYIEVALDEDLGLEDAEKAIEGSFAKSFTDQKKFGIMRFIFLQLVKNIPINPLDDLLSEGTLTNNIISPILRSFFHNPTIHPSIWPNTASMSSKVRKLANFDPSRAKQPDMVGNIVNNNKSSYEMMFGEITGEGKNNKAKKNNLDLIRLGVFMKDALDILIKKLGKDRIVFSWQSIVTSWTGYIMVLVAPGLYLMIDVDHTELPKSFQICGQFINGIDNLFTFSEKYKCEVKRTRDDINRMKEQKKYDDFTIEAIKWCRATLGTPQFRKLVKRT